MALAVLGGPATIAILVILYTYRQQRLSKTCSITVQWQCGDTVRAERDPFVGIEKQPCRHRDPRDHIHIRILQTMISGTPLILGLGARMSDPDVYVVFRAPKI